ncbi:MAG: N-acetyltransferase family protein [Bacteroidota bacterium]
MTTIRTLEAEDWEEVRRIYLEGIATGNATFQTSAPEWGEWDSAHLANLRYVITQGGDIAGWVALSPVSSRCVYGGVAEVSIYISERFRGLNMGFQLLSHLITESEKQNIWTIQAGIFPENTSSIKLHEKAGFRTIGYREKVGKQHGVWRDVNLMERRSNVAGV